MTTIKDAAIIVTGASSGIGAACAKDLAARGGRVVLMARSEDALEGVCEAIRASGGTADYVACDLGDAKAAARAFEDAERVVGPIDILVNNAGAGNMRFIEETTDEEAMRCMSAPYFSTFFLTRAAVPSMLARSRGHIVNVTSVASFLAWPGATAYTAARWAVRGFTMALRSDLRGTGVRVSLAAFSKVSSPYFDNNPGSEAKVPSAQKLIPVLSPEDVAEAIARGIERNKAEIIAPPMMKALLTVNKYSPSLIRWLSDKTGAKR